MLFCTSCKLEPRVDQRPTATNRWCGKCRAALNRKSYKERKAKDYAAGFADGSEAMRQTIIRTLYESSRVSLSRLEAVDFIRAISAPSPAEPIPEPQSAHSGNPTANRPPAR